MGEIVEGDEGGVSDNQGRVFEKVAVTFARVVASSDGLCSTAMHGLKGQVIAGKEVTEEWVI